MIPGERFHERDQRRRRAAALLVIAWVLRLHRWVPAFLVVAFVSWLILHHRLEAGLGHVLARQWRRAWPPGPLVLVALLCASTIAFVLADVPTTAKVMPVAINILALSMLLAGAWWTLFARPRVNVPDAPCA